MNARLILATLALLLTWFLFAPAAAYFPNVTEVSVSLTQVIAIAWPVALGLLAVAGLVSRLGAGAHRWTVLTFLWLATLAYVQGYLLVWDYGQFDGGEVDWGRFRSRGVVELGVWALITVGVVVGRHRVFRHAVAFALVLIGLQGFSLGSQLLRGGSIAARTATDASDGIFDFSPDRNVLVVVLDAFQQTAFQRILTRRPELAEALDGFTLYHDALGVYPTTLMSIPAMLSGRVYDNTEPIGDFLTESMANSLPVALEAAGFSSHTVTKPSYCPYLPGVHCAGQRDFLESPRQQARRDALQIWDVALFRSVPHVLKPTVYRDHQWLLQRTLLAPASAPVEGDDQMELIAFQDASWSLWDRLLEDATAQAPQPTFKFIHLFTTHSPFVLDADCEPFSKRAFRILTDEDKFLAQCECSVERLLITLERLRALSIYDQSLLIITADHGSKTQLIPPDRRFERLTNLNRVFPLLLVKPPGARGRLRSSEHPVSLADLPRTVCEVMGVASDFEGVSVVAPSVPARTRRYYDYTWKSRYWEAAYLPYVTEFLIDGPARDPASWQRGRVIRDPATEGQGFLRRQ